MTCGIPEGDGWCAEEDVREFLVGKRCMTKHSPAKLAGREDITPDPDLTLEALQRKAHHAD